MDNSGRYVNPSLSELVDRLTVDQIKEILLPPEQESFGKEIEKIEQDLDNILSSSAFRLTSRSLRLVIALAQMNLHIWKTKERMTSDASCFNEHLKLSHQLNGLRNQLKNALLEESGVRKGTPAKTNVGTDNLQGWQLSVLFNHDGSSLPGGSAKLEERHYRLVLTDIIDALTINQIKEVFSNPETTVKGVAETENLALDLDLNLKERDVRRKGRLIGLIALLAQANLHVWLNKDSMGSGGAHYHRLLDFAQDMNGLRNHVRNILMEDFGESEACNKRAIFLSRDPGKWYSPILRRLNRNGKESGTSLPAFRKNDLLGCLGIEEAELSEDCREILRDKDFGYRKLEGPERGRSDQGYRATDRFR